MNAFFPLWAKIYQECVSPVLKNDIRICKLELHGVCESYPNTGISIRKIMKRIIFNAISIQEILTRHVQVGPSGMIVCTLICD